MSFGITMSLPLICGLAGIIALIAKHPIIALSLIASAVYLIIR